MIPLYQELYLPLTSALLTGVTDTFRQCRTQSQHAINRLLIILGSGDVIDQRRTDHDTVGQTGDGRRLLRGTDTKADADRQVGMPTQTGYGLFDVLQGGGTGTGHTGHGHVVHKAGAAVEHGRQAHIIGGRRGHASRVFPLYGYPNNGSLDDPYPAATSWTYEIGLKANLFSNRLSIDASLFQNKVKDGLLSYIDPLTSSFQSTYQDYETKGIEIQANAQVSDGLSVLAGVGYIDSSLGAGGLESASIKGNRVPNTPKLNFNAGLKYDVSAGVIGLPGKVVTDLQYQYIGSRTSDVNESFTMGSYQIVNTRIGWKNNSGDWELYAFGRNLLNKRYEVFGASTFGAQVVTVGDGRIAGVGITKYFD